MNIKELVKKAVGINIGSFRESVNKANTNILNKKVYVKPEIDLSPVDVVFNERLNAIEEGGAGGGTSFGGDIESLSEAAKTAKEGEMFRLTKDDVYISEEKITYNSGEWRSITRAEAQYLFTGRENAVNLRTAATVNGINGLILLPDNFTCPKGIDLKINKDLKPIDNNFTESEWYFLEKAGAVFLPASGMYRDELRQYKEINGSGRYWTGSWWNKSYHHSATSCDYSLLENYIVPQNDWYRTNCFSVRLVKNSNEGFSVSDTTKIIFANGNIQYLATENKWRFANRQYGSISKFCESSEQNEWADLLPYGHNGYSLYPYQPSPYAPDFCYKDISETVWDWGYNEIEGVILSGKEFKAGSLVVYKDGQFEPMVEPQENDNQCYLNDYVNTDEKLNFNVIKMPAINGNNFTLIIDEKDVDQTTKLIILDGNKKEEINLIDKYDFDAGFYVIEKLYPFTPKFYIEKNGVKSPMLTPVGIAMNMGMNNTYNITKSNGYIGPKYDTLILERAYRVGTQDFISVINNNFYGINFIDFEPVKRTIGYNVYANSNKLLGYTYHMVNGTTCDIEDKHTYIGDMVHFKYIPRASYNLDYIEFENEKIELREDNDYYVKKTLIISTIYIVETAIV